MTEWSRVRDELRDFALGLPETREDHPWGETVVKVGKKVFLFLGMDGPSERTDEPADTTEDPAGKWAPGFSVKLLSEAHGHALTVEGAAPTGYGLGKAGWVTVPFLAELPDTEVLLDWVEESYRTIAPKRAVRALDERP
ncbi:MmcQ/YjbR family DNA-binding protein [Nonomuraea roseoviolacea]|uniref:DNA-binding protein (MmcQ/YjbR family) n=1 Tax=Nonomuraea roseoviolacea subsp. carminata TaxID=160689 RepID=A0ABT1K280_9ACTN|nr:MmcQ/YjbR family DNA-binding protein [Nonomuraea roseoviolacea]MCP2347722.1 putative DNA-binding protein (MmcQ/YjbR family) [Nonomuraea roseoviolacea subsp. carminata]